jgi:hypothetical protein
LTETVAVSSDTELIAVYLLQSEDSAEPNFFAAADLSGGLGSCTFSYWLDYERFFHQNQIQYGLSRQFAQLLPLDSTVDQDFYLAPYFLYRIADLRNASFSLLLEPLEGNVNCRACATFENLIADSSITTILLGVEKRFTGYPDEQQFVVVLPSDYYGNAESRSRLTATDVSEELKAEFSFYYSVLASDRCLYFADYGNQVLKKWDLSAKTITVQAHFASPIQCLVENADGSIFYLAEGKNIWSYDVATQALQARFAAPYPIYSLYVLGDYLISCESSSSWATNRLIRLADFEDVDARDLCYASRTYLFDAVSGRLITLRDNMTPNDICCQAVDLVNEQLGAWTDSIYHGQYALGHPLKLTPDGSRILTSPGNVFSTEAGFAYSGSLGYSYADLVFHEGRIYLLHNEQPSSYSPVRCRLMVLDLAPPYSLIGVPLEFERKGRKLELDGEELLVVSQPSNSLSTNAWSNDTGTIEVQRYRIADLQAGSLLSACGAVRRYGPRALAGPEGGGPQLQAARWR